MPKVVHFSEGLARVFGLEEVWMDNLGPLVVLAGPNGSGKTRYLDQIDTAVSETENRCRRVAEMHRHISRTERELAEHEGNADKIAAISNQKAGFERELENLWESDPLLEELAKHYGTDFSKWRQRWSLLPVSMNWPATRKLTANHTETEWEQAVGRVENAHPCTPNQAYENLPVVVEEIARALYSSRHPEATEDEVITRRALRATRANEFLKEALGFQIGYKMERGRVKALVEGIPFEPNRYSPGQQFLLAWAYALAHGQNAEGGEIFAWDEPEAHLHAGACIQVIDKLLDFLGDKGQLWIATHSLPIIARAGLRNVWFTKDNGLVRATKAVEENFARLLGGQEGAKRLRVFLDDAQSVSALTFAQECLDPPGVAEHRHNDPQHVLILLQVRDKQILDFGAGRGRLAEELGQEADLGASFHYAAYEPDPEHGEERERAVAQLRGQTLDTLDGIEDTYEVVVVCNVLHEIPVREWPGLFTQIAATLNDTGYMLLVEDQQPSIGELPHSGGFVILEFDELRALFPEDAEVFEERERNRLTAFRVPKATVDRFDAGRLPDCLNRVAQRCINKLADLRADDETPPHRVGRLAMLYTTMHANAHLALQELTRRPAHSGDGASSF